MEIQIIDNGVVLATISFADGVKVAETGAKAPAKAKVEAKASKKTEAKASAKRSKSERSSENKTRYAKLNSQLGLASRASKNTNLSEAEKEEKIALALAKAMELASKPTVWQKDVNRVLSKAEEYGLSLS